jgi:acetyl-CoA carboxylase carboxyl transferase subunit beta
MTHFDKPTYTVRKTRKKDIPQGIYTKDPLTGEAIFTKELADNQMVVPKSGHHFPIGARERIARLLDENSFVETNNDVRSSDPLNFVDSVPYPVRIKKYETLGSAAGEKITRAIELAVERKIPCIIFSTSGGARMQEGILSLMQMAKTSAALGRLAEAKLPYISVLTHPTTGGVSASYATLGDVILAEPGALIGFAGPRVIKDTTKQTLPAGFQTSEFLLKHGLIDQIVPRGEMRDRLGDLLLALYVKKKKKPAAPMTKS